MPKSLINGAACFGITTAAFAISLVWSQYHGLPLFIVLAMSGLAIVLWTIWSEYAPGLIAGLLTLGLASAVAMEIVL